ncbi:MAG: F0F1 ATP synthase subunit delta [Proteobacteria bacterium]|nr:F0F1 ATP synthase subunit delta [Pseudomonadota bacterium]MBU4298018.1 F0F1 ATP synthase subunit delta [Pseudomonadota bacterium]MCG2749578.1 F0F1 ATP synthase subunit delta [Desulfobulbaceae bacterium]
MKNDILAKRYAKAVFIVGKEENALDDYAKTLKDFAELYTTLPEVRDGLTNRIYPADVREKVMAAIVKKAGVSQIMGNFLNLLAQKNRANVLPEIAASFQGMVDVERNVCQGIVITAKALEPALLDKAKQTLEKITGKQVVLKTEIDTSIIGGMIAKVGDIILDGSIKTQLEGLKESIKGSE